MYVAPQVVIVLAHTTHLATILKLGLALYTIFRRGFYLTKVSSLLIAFSYFLKSSVRSLFDFILGQMQEGDGRAGGRATRQKATEGAQRDR